MKRFKKIVLSIAVFFALLLLGGYFYFQHTFSPAENYLSVSGIAQDVPLQWDSDQEHSAIYLPIRISGIDKVFYMQLDSGSPVTLFYKAALASLPKEFRPKIDAAQMQVSLGFNLGKMQVSSQKFLVLDYGEKVDLEDPSAQNIIGTIGTDLFEKRVVILDFRKNVCSFATNHDEKGFGKMAFTKRRILLPASLENEELKLLYDSGSSAYELITNKEQWAKLKAKGSKTKVEKGNSWGNELKVVSSAANRQIEIGNMPLRLSEVTYVEGISQFQNFLMKSSGMQGMIGNKLFLSHKLTFDCANERFKIE